MNKIEQYKKEIKELLTRTTTIKATAQDEARELKDDELTILNDILDRVDTLEGLIKTEERLQAATNRMATSADPGNIIKPEINKPNIVVGIDNRSLDTFKSFGEQLSAVAQYNLRGVMDPRLETRAPSGLSELVPSDGGFLVQKDFANELIKPVYTDSAIFSRCKHVTVGPNSNGLKLNAIAESSRVSGSRYGGLNSYWLEEAGTKTASAPKFRKMELTLEKLVALAYLTDELLQDSVAMDSIVREGFAAEMTFKVEDAILRGSGAGQPLGIIGHASAVSVSKETGQAADTILSENVINMWARMYSRSRTNAIWLINQDIEPQLYTMSLAIGTGGSLMYIPAGGLSGQMYGTLFGRPVIPCEQASTLGDVGDIMLLDLSQYLAITKGGVKSDSSIHVRFVNDETCLRFVWRIDAAPLWNLPLTPFKGSNTLSPFIMIENRS